MCIEYNECHYGGMYNVYVKEFFCYYGKCLYTHKYKFSFEKEPVNESPSR